MQSRAEEKQGILNRLQDGSLSFASEAEYQNLMTLFPDRGEIPRAYADFLMRQHKTDDAYWTYTHAADLFLVAGQTFQAIVATILAWRIVKPAHDKGRAFHNALQASIKMESPLQGLFNELSYKEFISLMLVLVRVHFGAGVKVLRRGQSCENVFFIVSGMLEETIANIGSAPAEKSKASPLHLSDNDICGDIFPLQAKTHCLSDVQTITPVEAVKINKAALIHTCRKYPRLEKFLEKLYKGPPGMRQGRSWSSVRRSTRHEYPVRTTVRLSLRKDDPNPIAFEGMSKDISIGGTCIDLGLKYGAMRPEALSGVKSIVEIKLPSGEGVSIPGWVSWCKKVKEPGGISIVAGIKFQPIDADVRDFLKVHCFGYENEQSLMWELWEGYLK